MAQVKTRSPMPTSTASLPALDDLPIEEIWIEHQRTGGETTRNYLAEHYLHIVRFLADRLHSRLPREVEAGDLAQQGYFGLLDAINSFDLGNGAKFETFAVKRIRGAMLDYLRSIDRVSRGKRDRERRLDHARRSHFARFGCSPDDEQLLDALGPDPVEARRCYMQGRPVRLISIERRWNRDNSDNEVGEIDILEDTAQPNPLLHAQRDDLKHFITKSLSRAERLIVILYYYEEMTMKEIGDTLDLSESRVSQMHSSILARIRAQMTHREREFHER